jgi:hypothetical protein
MPNIQAVTLSRHSARGWLRPDNYLFSKSNTIVNLTADEMSDAVFSLPTAFLRVDEDLSLVALTGILENENAMIDRLGRWRGQYIPATLRLYPFRLGQVERGKGVVCVDEESGLVVELVGDAGSPSTSKPIPFFYRDNAESDELAKVSNYLKKIYAAQEFTKSLCEFLDQLDLLKPWVISVQGGKDGQEENSSISVSPYLKHLYCVDESKINSLPPDKLAQFRDNGGLWVSHCQRLSMRNLHKLIKRTKSHIKDKSEKSSDSIFELKDSGSVNLDNI